LRISTCGNLDGIEISQHELLLSQSGSEGSDGFPLACQRREYEPTDAAIYSNLAAGTPTAPVTKAQALRQAQLSMLRGKALTTINAVGRAIIEVRLD
jgi:hypothetical protein